MQPLRAYKVLIADPQPLFRKGLRTILSSQPDLSVVADTCNLPEAVEMAQSCAPDALAMNSFLLGDAAADRPARLKELAKSLPVIVLTEEGDLPLLESCRPDCVPRGAETDAILAAIRLRAYRFRQDENPGMAAGLQALAQSTRSAATIPGLTVRETEVLRLLAEHLTAREIAEELGLSIKTIEAHKLNLMRKLGIHDRASLIEYAAAHDTPVPVP